MYSLFYSLLFHELINRFFLNLSADCADLFLTSDEGELQFLFTYNGFQFAQFLLDATNSLRRRSLSDVIKAH